MLVDRDDTLCVAQNGLLTAVLEELVIGDEPVLHVVGLFFDHCFEGLVEDMSVLGQDPAMVFLIEDLDFADGLAPGGNLPGEVVMAVPVLVSGDPEFEPLGPHVGDESGGPSGSIQSVGELVDVRQVVFLESAPLSGPSALEEVVPADLSLPPDELFVALRDSAKVGRSVFLHFQSC